MIYFQQGITRRCDIIIAALRHVEAIILMKRSGSETKKQGLTPKKGLKYR